MPEYSIRDAERGPQVWNQGCMGKTARSACVFVVGMVAAGALGSAPLFAAPDAPLQLVPPTAAAAKPHHAAKPTKAAKAAKASATKPAKAHAAKPVAAKPLAKNKPVATKPVATKHAAAAKAVQAALHVPLPRQRPHAAIPAAASAYADVGAGKRAAPDPTFKPPLPPVFRPAAPAVSHLTPPAVSQPTPPPVFRAMPVAASPNTPPADLTALKAVIDAAQKRKGDAADAAQRTIGDPLVRKLAEWVILRGSSDLSFERYAAFIEANPDWPLVPLFRRRAEGALWNDQINDLRVIAFFAKSKPTTAKGRYVLARALLNQGDHAAAAALVRHAWRYQDCSAEIENRVLEAFGGLLTRADDKARMDQRFYDSDTDAGLRMAKRLGGDQLAIAKAWAAVIHGARNATALLDAVPAAARHDPGYLFARTHWLRRENKIEEAGRMMLEAPREADAAVDPDRWWQDRRILVRDLLDSSIF